MKELGVSACGFTIDAHYCFLSEIEVVSEIKLKEAQLMQFEHF